MTSPPNARDRFDETIGSRWPATHAALRPGAGDGDLDQLRAAVAPFALPVQVETLYGWHDGGDRGVFGCWRIRPIDDLIDAYRVAVDVLDRPRTWLPVFDDQIQNIVTLDVPGRAPSDASVWYGHTHDDPLYRLFESIDALLHVVCDAAEADLLVQDDGRLGLAGEGGRPAPLDDRLWEDLRLARSPGSYRRTDPPEGTELSSLPDPRWSDAWRLGLVDASPG